MQTAIQKLQSQLRDRVTPAMATPLTQDGYHVNYDVVPDLVNFLIERNVSGLFVGGTTGEGILLEMDERKRLHEVALQAAAGRVPVLVHVGTNDTRSSLDLAVHASEIGADAIVAVAPSFYGMPDAALLSHFKTVANGAPEVPFLVYDIPQMAINGVSPALARNLVRELPSLAGVKCSHTDMQAIRRLIDAVPDDYLVLAGNEPIMLGSLALGASGAISGLATAVPEPFVALLEAFSLGDMDEARNWQRLINQMHTCFEPGIRIGGIKAILNSRGVLVNGPMPPRPAGSADLWSKIQALMDQM
jgi:dihydrodipicolinate synthase/N-acetylneuraminate lyase